MITTFICNAPGCANEGVTYNMEDAGDSVMCGGCKSTLFPVSSE